MTYFLLRFVLQWVAFLLEPLCVCVCVCVCVCLKTLFLMYLYIHIHIKKSFHEQYYIYLIQYSILHVHTWASAFAWPVDSTADAIACNSRSSFRASSASCEQIQKIQMYIHVHVHVHVLVLVLSCSVVRSYQV